MHANDHAREPHDVRAHLAAAVDTERFGERIAAGLERGVVVTLSGDLGTGKTTLVRGMLRGLGWTGAVKSPTYTLVEHYILSRLYFYHFDFYRLDNPDEWEGAGFGDYFGEDSVCVVEWPERVGSHLPAADLAIDIAYAGSSSDAGREVRCTAHSAAGARCLTAARDRSS